MARRWHGWPAAWQARGVACWPCGRVSWRRHDWPVARQKAETLRGAECRQPAGPAAQGLVGWAEASLGPALISCMTSRRQWGWKGGWEGREWKRRPRGREGTAVCCAPTCPISSRSRPRPPWGRHLRVQRRGLRHRQVRQVRSSVQGRTV